MKKNRSIEKHKVGVIGLGYVGLPRALQFCKKKNKCDWFWHR